MDNLTLGEIQRALEKLPEPKPFVPKFILAHPDDWEQIVTRATRAGLFLAPYYGDDDQRGFRLISIVEAFDQVFIEQHYLALSERVTPGKFLIVDIPKDSPQAWEFGIKPHIEIEKDQQPPGYR